MNTSAEDADLNNYKLLREEIRFEHGQIAQRMNWFVVSQTFLMTPYAISRGGTRAAQLELFWGTLLPVTGVVMATLIFVAILAAVDRVRDHRRTMKERHDNETHLKRGSDLARSCAILVPQVMPIAFACLWLLLLWNDNVSLSWVESRAYGVGILTLLAIFEVTRREAKFYREVKPAQEGR